MSSDYISLVDSIPLFPSRPCKNTVVRWANRGVYGVKLRTVRFAGKRLTRKAWVEEFCAALFDQAPTGDGVAPDACAAAEARLDAMGVV